MSVLEFFSQLRRFLAQNDIDPGKVKLVLRADDEFVRGQLEIAMTRSLQSEMQLLRLADVPIKNLIINGIRIGITSLDRSR